MKLVDAVAAGMAKGSLLLTTRTDTAAAAASCQGTCFIRWDIAHSARETTVVHNSTIADELESSLDLHMQASDHQIQSRVTAMLVEGTSIIDVHALLANLKRDMLQRGSSIRPPSSSLISLRGQVICPNPCKAHPSVITVTHPTAMCCPLPAAKFGNIQQIQHGDAVIHRKNVDISTQCLSSIASGLAGECGSSDVSTDFEFADITITTTPSHEDEYRSQISAEPKFCSHGLINKTSRSGSDSLNDDQPRMEYSKAWASAVMNDGHVVRRRELVTLEAAGKKGSSYSWLNQSNIWVCRSVFLLWLAACTAGYCCTQRLLKTSLCFV